MEQTPRINSMQILAMLLVSRFFTLLVAVPNSRYTMEGSDGLLLPLFSTALTLLSAIPLLLLMKRFPQQSLHEITARIAPKAEKLILLFQLLLCFTTAVAAASQSEYFVSTALYPQASRPWVIFLFVLLLWYMISMGIEAISRVSLLVCALIVFSFALIFSGVFSQIDWLTMTKPFYEPLSRIATSTLAYWGQNMELLLLLLLQPNSRESRFTRDFLCFSAAALLITELLSFFSLTVLGDYGKTRMYPIYTLASLSGHGFFSRLDYLHIVNWTFACLLRAAFFAYAAAKLLESLLPRQKAVTLRLLTAAAVFAVVLLLSYVDGSFQFFYEMYASGIPLLFVSLVIPLYLLWKSRKGRLSS